jgi:hypothetical protein
MKTPDDSTPLGGYDMERLVAEHRERIIALEAHGMPAEDADELWDVLADILAQMKRHQTLGGPEGKLPV